LAEVIKSHAARYQIPDRSDIKDARARFDRSAPSAPFERSPPHSIECRSVSKETVLSDESRESSNDRQQDRIIMALLEHPTLERAAAALDMSKATLWRWTQNPSSQ
jgi:hypothetical protein